jgi:hypothetical protein
VASIVISAPARQVGVTHRRLRTRSWLIFERFNGWLAAVVTLALALSVGACIAAFQHHTILLYSDAYAHMIISRRVIDNSVPGLAQLGGVWLPLPHLIMLPFVWNMFLWSSGLGGSIPSMLCYIASAVYVFLAAQRVTKSGVASFLGTLVFLVNPNVLYVQSTPLSEPIMILTMTMTSYYFLAWAKDGRQNDLILAATCTFFATLARYDGWPLFLVVLVLIVVIGRLKQHTASEIKGNLVLYGTLGGFGIALWFLWNLVIFSDPFYFFKGPYSSQIMQAPLINAGLVATYHNIFQSIYYYGVVSIETMGPIIFVLATIAVLAYVFRRRLSPEVAASLVFLVPFAFYVFSLWSGQAIEYAPHAVPAQISTLFYNDRYGTQAVAPAAFFIAILASMLHRWLRPLLGMAIVAQVLLTATGGIITLQDGLYGASCSPYRATTSYLALHYDGSNILEDEYFQNPQDFAFTVGIDLKHIVYQGSGRLWQESLADPAANVHWIYARTGDLVTAHIDVDGPDFLSKFSLVARDSDGAMLYHLNSAPLAQHAVPSSVLTLHSACIKQSPGSNAGLTRPSSLFAGEEAIIQPNSRTHRLAAFIEMNGALKERAALS